MSTTRREAIDALRDSYSAALFEHTEMSVWSIKELSAKKYPYPKGTTVPREVQDRDGDFWRYTQEEGLQYRRPDGVWLTPIVLADASWPSEDYRLVLADVLSNPTKEVEDDQ